MTTVHTVEVEVGGRTITLETGKLAKQANGAVLVRCEDTVVLATAVAREEMRENQDFFPLTVDVEERMYAAGKIPGGFIKRESRPSDKATLTARQIDRPIRPSFPKGFMNEVQIIGTVLSYDQDNAYDVLAMTGASAALTISEIPFLGPLGAVRVGLIDGEYVVNPLLSRARRRHRSTSSCPAAATPSSWSRPAPTRPARSRSSRACASPTPRSRS